MQKLLQHYTLILNYYVRRHFYWVPANDSTDFLIVMNFVLINVLITIKSNYKNYLLIDKEITEM